MSKEFLFFAPALPPENIASAVRCGYFAKHFHEQGLEFCALTCTPKPTSQGYATRTLFFRLASNKSSFLVRFAFEFLVGMELLFHVAVRSLKGKTQRFVLLSSPPYISVLVSGLFLRLLGIPYILDIRDPYPEVYFQHGLINKHSFAGKIQTILAGLLYQGAAKIFAASEGFAKMIHDYLPDPQKVVVVKNGFDETLFRPSAEKFDQFTCVFHGNLGHMQNIELLIEVARRLETLAPEVQIQVIGRGPQEYLLKSPGLPTNLQYLGEMPYKDLARHLAKTHLGLSFRKEGALGETALPVKVFEYIGVGIPSVVTPPSEMGELLTEHEIGFQFRNENPQIIAECIAKLAVAHGDYTLVTTKLKESRAAFSRENSARQAAEYLMNQLVV